jgi:hypothetical protein
VDSARILSNAVNRTSSETPKTTYGTTSGEKNRAEAAGLPTKRRRTSTNAARTPRVTAIVLEHTATIALRFRAWKSVGFDRKRSYHWVVNPSRGKLTSPALNEKIARIAIGRYRNSTSAMKNSRSSPSALLDAAASTVSIASASRRRCWGYRFAA